MKSACQQAVREELKSRLAKLRQNQTPGWGKMTAGRMVVHIADSFRSALGELTIKPRGGPMRYPPLRQLIIYWVPFPKNLPTAPELIARQPGEWASDVKKLAALIDKFGTRDRHSAWPDHGAFGSLSADEWGVLMYRHTDHHFRQFGI